MGVAQEVLSVSRVLKVFPRDVRTSCFGGSVSFGEISTEKQLQVCVYLREVKQILFASLSDIEKPCGGCTVSVCSTLFKYTCTLLVLMCYTRACVMCALDNVTVTA